MANPQLENGHIEIANELWEALMQADLKKNEWKALFVILRFSLGCKKYVASLTQTEISQLGKIPLPRVNETISSLQEKRIISRDRKSDKIRFYKNYEKWQLDETLTKNCVKSNLLNKTLSKNLMKCEVELNETLSQNAGDGSKIKGKEASKESKESIKETLSKDGSKTSNENKKPKRSKKKGDPNVKKFLNAFRDSFREEFGEEYPVNWGKDGAIVKGLLVIYDYNKLITFVDKFFKLRSDFISRAGYTIGVFKSQIPALISATKRSNRMDQRGQHVRPEDFKGGDRV